MDSNLHERLWKKIDVRGADDCWPFTGYRLTGYGRIGLGSRADGVAYAHRVVAEQFHGPCPPGQTARHLCGNRACCNPAHLAWGDQSANERDKLMHGRSNRGERHGMSKLTEDQVRGIRAALSSGESQRSVGAVYGISGSTVSEIHRGLIWNWLT